MTSFKFAYDPVAALNNAPKLLGMDLERRGDKWEGGYYMNGERHAVRKDKLKVFLWKGEVYVAEEGGRCISLPHWLMEYGGVSNFKEAVKRIKGESQTLHWENKVRQKSWKALYVDNDVLRGAKLFPLEKSPLFRWMCGLFNEVDVRRVWNEYNVTVTDKGGTIFWYLNQYGKICHDKIVWYKEDGHRNRLLPMGRRYRKADGYTENPLFGAHLKGEVKGVLESEKSALMAALHYGGIWLATGGKNQLPDNTGYLLYPDRDAESSWMLKGECVQWYSDWPECGEHSDLGDLIEYERTKRSDDEA